MTCIRSDRCTRYQCIHVIGMYHLLYRGTCKPKPRLHPVCTRYDRYLHSSPPCTLKVTLKVTRKSLSSHQSPALTASWLPSMFRWTFLHHSIVYSAWSSPPASFVSFLFGSSSNCHSSGTPSMLDNSFDTGPPSLRPSGAILGLACSAFPCSFRWIELVPTADPHTVAVGATAQQRCCALVERPRLSR